MTYALGFFYPILFILFTGPGNLYILYRHNIDSESKELEINKRKFSILAINVHRKFIIIYVLFSREFC